MHEKCYTHIQAHPHTHTHTHTHTIYPYRSTYVLTYHVSYRNCPMPYKDVPEPACTHIHTNTHSLTHTYTHTHTHTHTYTQTPTHTHTHTQTPTHKRLPHARMRTGATNAAVSLSEVTLLFVLV